MNKREVRFWQNVDKTSYCWIWGHGKMLVGKYGSSSWKGKKQRAHRISWFLHFGTIPNGMSVLHKCDNPPCVNPSHLWLGTQKQNVEDRDTKERRSLKLGKEEVLNIRRDYLLQKGSTAELAMKYRVSQPMISMVVNRKTWRRI